jgi:hypothetical protein
MSHTPGQIRTTTTAFDAEWPTRTQDVSYVGAARVIHGRSDFDLADLNAVRGRFPGQHVTLDGDVITVWPPAAVKRVSSALTRFTSLARPLRPADHLQIPHRKQAAL